MLELGMGAQSGADILRRIRPLDAGIHAFGILAEYGGIDLRLVEASISPLANVIQRIAGKADAGAHADIQIELLPHGHDRAVVDEFLVAQFRLQFGLGFFVRF